MSKNNENKLVPTLRFPEFKNDGEWNEKELGEVGQFKNGVNFSPNQKGTGYLTVDVLNMYGLAIETNLDSLYRIDIEAKDSILKENDLLFVRSSLKREGVGWVSLFPISDEPVLFCGFLIRMRMNSFQEHSARYLAYYLRSDIGRRKIISLSGTGAITNISQDSLKEIKAPFPSTLKEQQKIATCLSSLDEVITAENQKLDILQDHKKGLLQNLLPQEGETIPKFRFKEFVDSGEWEEKELDNFCINLSSGKDKNVADGEYELYGSTGIIGRAENASYEGDFILVARVGANAGLLNKVKGKFGVTDNTLVIDLVKKNLINFIFYSLESVGLNKLVFGSGQPLITGGQLKSFLLSIPKSEQEQQQIADTLSSIDELINAQSQKVDALKLHKKGLLQGLFPHSLTANSPQ